MRPQQDLQLNPELAQVLNQLRDIHLPPEPSFWPPAIGYVLIALVLVALSVLAFVIIKKFASPPWYRSAQNILKAPMRSWEDAFKAYDKQQMSQEDYLTVQSQVLLQINHLLKRVALTLQSRDQTAQLIGPQWCQWLDQQYDGNFFRDGPGQVLAHGIYKPAQQQKPIDPKVFASGLQTWFKAIRLKNNTPASKSIAIRNKNSILKE